MNSVTAAYRDANKKSHSPVSSCKPTDIATAPTPYRIHNGPFTSPRLENFRCINVAAAVSNTQPAKEYIKNSHNKSYPVNCIIRMSSSCFFFYINIDIFLEYTLRLYRSRHFSSSKFKKPLQKILSTKAFQSLKFDNYLLTLFFA